MFTISILEKLAYAVKARRPRQVGEREPIALAREGSSTPDQSEDDNNWEVIAVTIDRCLFLFFNLVFIVGLIAIFISMKLGSYYAYVRMLGDEWDCGYGEGHCWGKYNH